MPSIKMVEGRRSIDHPLYQTWRNMKSRCSDVNCLPYPSYGGRGIKVCAEWQESFAKFVEDMGPRPEGWSLDRINNDGNYEPSNCRWASHKIQQGNKRNIRRYDYDGRSLTIPEWAEVTGLTTGLIWSRINRYGWSVERALTEKVRKNGK